MSMPGTELPAYPKAGGATSARLKNARHQYEASSESIDSALAKAERAFGDAFADADARNATSERIRAAANKNRDVARRNH